MATTFGSLRKATQAIAGVPSLFAAARGAGASVAAATDVLAASAAALRIAAGQGRGAPGLQNAVRHFIWQAYLTARHGPAVAEAVAAAQEAGRDAPGDTRVDLHNNAIGRAHGAADAARIKQGSRSEALAALVPVAKDKWDAGELIWIKPR